MEIPNNTTKAKEPVRLRFKALSNGNKSLYLDFYQNGKRKYEFLKLYLIPEISPLDRIANINTLKVANEIKAKRLFNIIHGRSGISEATQCHMLSEWINVTIERKRNKVSASSIKGLSRLRRHLNKYKDDTRLIDVDKQFCIGFTDYLRNAVSLKVPKDPSKEPKKLARITQAELLNTLSIVLNEAVREGLIQTNAVRLLSKTEKIKKPESTREYLALEELKRLIDTPVEANAEQDKKAFLFCCFCGLRYSDVSALKWGNIIKDGEKVSISIVQKKTKQPVVAPLSDKAVSYLPDQNGKRNDEKVFILPNQSVTNKRLKKWAKDAKVYKNVTFHVSRHTFGTMMLTAGADIYTTSK
ncbi:MAG: site-specific integrase, partial [Muribaculaceae bacterium]|nr:site-specific integrase [Muribaculaceae bacterium]